MIGGAFAALAAINAATAVSAAHTTAATLLHTSRRPNNAQPVGHVACSVSVAPSNPTMTTAPNPLVRKSYIPENKR
jgi:hypothetical protein